MIMCLFTLQEQIKEFNFLELMILFFLKPKSQVPNPNQENINHGFYFKNRCFFFRQKDTVV